MTKKSVKDNPKVVGEIYWCLVWVVLSVTGLIQDGLKWYPKDKFNNETQYDN
jgi:hypothetical protein